MPRPSRATGPLLDVSTCLLRAYTHGEELHGWAIMKETKRSGPTVYGVLDRLEDRNWITGHWEEQDQDSSKPRRRFYRLTPRGLAEIQALLAERRPGALKDLDGYGKGIAVPGGWRLSPGSQ